MTLEVYYIEDLDMDVVELDFTGKWQDVKKQIDYLKKTNTGFPKKWEDLPVYEYLTIEEVNGEDDDESFVWNKIIDDVYGSGEDKTLKELFDDYTYWYVMDDGDKKKIVAYMKNGEDYEWCVDNLPDLEMYEFAGCYNDEETLAELARLMVDEGFFGEVPERIKMYIDYEFLGRDLGVDYTVVEPGVVIRMF